MGLGELRLSASTGVAKHSKNNQPAISLKTTLFLDPGRALRVLSHAICTQRHSHFSEKAKRDLKRGEGFSGMI